MVYGLGQPKVFRAIDGKAVMTPVKIGRSDATHTIILSGVTEEDAVIVGPFKELEKLAHDQKIKDEREVEAAKAKAKDADTDKATKAAGEKEKKA